MQIRIVTYNDWPSEWRVEKPSATEKCDLCGRDVDPEDGDTMSSKGFYWHRPCFDMDCDEVRDYIAMTQEWKRSLKA